MSIFKRPFTKETSENRTRKYFVGFYAPCADVNFLTLESLANGIPISQINRKLIKEYKKHTHTSVIELLDKIVAKAQEQWYLICKEEKPTNIRYNQFLKDVVKELYSIKTLEPEQILYIKNNIKQF